MQFVLTLILQLAAGLLLAPTIIGALPLGRAYHLVYAVVLGLLLWLAGLIVARLLKRDRDPGMGALAAAVIGALVGVGITLLPTFVPGAESAVRLIAEPLYLLVGALIGYWMVR